MITNIRKFIRAGLQPVIRQVAYSMGMTVRQLEAVALWLAAIFYIVSRVIMFPMLDTNGPDFISECIFSFIVGICLVIMAYATAIPRPPGIEEKAREIEGKQRGTLGWNVLRIVLILFLLTLLGIVFAPASLLTGSMTGDVYMKDVFSMLLRVVAGIIFISFSGVFSEDD